MLRSCPPASRSSTRCRPEAVRRLASTQPAVPAPTTMESEESAYIAVRLLGLETTLFGAASEAGRPPPPAGDHERCAGTEELTESVAYFLRLHAIERFR